MGRIYYNNYVKTKYFIKIEYNIEYTNKSISEY